MKSFFSRFWNGYKEYIVVVVLLVISLVLLSLSTNPAIKRVKTYAFGGFAVITSGVSKVIEPFQTAFETKRLREANAQLMMQVNRLREYGIQNEELKKLLALKDSSEYPLIAASVVSKFVSNSQGCFIINTGNNEGVQLGMPVINDQGLVGVVISVSKDFSIIRTLNNSELKFAVKNQRSKFDGVMEWNGTDLVIKNVPKTFDMEIGDRIVTSDFSTKFPPSIPVGVVAGGNRDKTGIFNNIVVRPYVDFIKVSNVFVIGFVPSVQKNNLELNLIRMNK
ncbi:MAG: rod shape-determining protein MreC [Bacteroidota bacterium]|nr:rod shape-determining protein MreC [Bacteroidota bacterium]MDP4190864.1 rod shape-determining protein MreC [Bacteroidota bacterium]MDP4193901.1 rod shape-determining protein MreC [Bacteroidota bacterium]